MLLQSGYLPINIKYADRRRYFDCFEAWDDRHDADPLITLVAAYAEARLTEWLGILDRSIAPD